MRQEESNLKYQKELTLNMVKCVFCKKDYDDHKGVTLVKNDGSINHLCSSKCRKNLLMNRRKVRWVEGFVKKRKNKKKKK